MRRLRGLGPSLAIFALSLLPLPTTAETVTCDAPAPVDATRDRANFAWEQHFIQLTRLGNQFMPSFGDGDSMTQPFSADQGTFNLYGATGFQETWYLAKEAGTNLAPLYRHYHNSLQNHLDSPNPTETGYTQEGVLGYAWNSDLGGMAALRRYYRSAISDHRTWLFGGSAPSGYTLNATWSSGSASPRLGYQRFGNLGDQCSTIQAGEALGSVLENSTLRVRFNKIWGNAIGEIVHKPSGKDMVSSSIGDMVQSVIWYGGPGGLPVYILNPTQSGGTDIRNYGATKRWAGSPILSETLSTSTNPPSMITEVKPLNFHHDLYTNPATAKTTDQWSPLLWRGRFRLTTTLGCFLPEGTPIVPTLKQDVVKITHEVRKDADATFADNIANLQGTGWFLMEPLGDCRLSNNIRVELINLQTGAILQSTPMACNTDYIFNSQTNRGIRIVGATVGGVQLAIGFLKLGAVDQLSARVGHNEYGNTPANQRLVLTASRFHSISASSWASDNTFYVIESPAQVLTRMTQIYADNNNCSN